MTARIFFGATLVVCCGFAAFQLNSRTSASGSGYSSADSPVQRKELLQAPDFDGVSAFDTNDTDRIDAWLQSQVEFAKYPSLSVAVVRDGKVVYQKALGFQDIETSTKATAETSYHVASVTKVFTTLVAATLHDRGVIDLDQPVLKYLPEEVVISTTPKVGATITLRQLASHTSGLPRGVPGRVQSVEGRYQLEPQRLYAHLAVVEMEFDPGTDERYSNLGIGLLGHALELASQKPFGQLVKEMVCDPLQLDRTTISDTDKLNVATGYSSLVPRRPETHSYLERLAPAGGLVTSVGDLAKFLMAHMKPGLLSKEVLSQLHTPTKMRDGSEASTGLGWAVRSRKSIGRILKKNGGRNNCKAWIGFSPEHQVGVAVVTNCGEPYADRIGYWLLERSVPGVAPSLLDRTPEVERVYAKVAPFTGVRWENDRPVVCVNGRWAALVSIDDIPIGRIIDFARRRFGKIAQKRFSEDLVEVLSTMGHDPKWKVTLGLETKDKTVDKLEVIMTEDNRKQVRNSLVRF